MNRSKHFNLKHPCGGRRLQHVDHYPNQIEQTDAALPTINHTDCYYFSVFPKKHTSQNSKTPNCPEGKHGRKRHEISIPTPLCSLPGANKPTAIVFPRARHSENYYPCHHVSNQYWGTPAAGFRHSPRTGAPGFNEITPPLFVCAGSSCLLFRSEISKPAECPAKIDGIKFRSVNTPPAA